MVSPQAIAAGVQAGASLFGALSGNKAKKKAQKQQQANEARQLALQQQQLEMAQEAQRLGLATQIDAQGNMSVYDKATNTWKVVLSPQQQQLQDASNNEQLAGYGDLTTARNQEQTQAGVRSQEGNTTAALRDQINRQISGGGQDSSRLAAALRLSRENALSNGFDSAQRGVATQALRSGATGFNAAASALGRAKAQAAASTMGAPEVEGLQLAESLNADKMAGMNSGYNLFASRAAANPNPTFTPTNYGSSLAGALGQRTAQGAAGAANLAGNYGQVAGAVDTGPRPVVDNSLWGGIADLAGSFAGNQDIGSILTQAYQNRTKKKQTGATVSEF